MGRKGSFRAKSWCSVRVGTGSEQHKQTCLPESGKEFYGNYLFFLAPPVKAVFLTIKALKKNLKIKNDCFFPFYFAELSTILTRK